MKNTSEVPEFDFIVIYSSKNAYSADNTRYKGNTPFSVKGAHASCNLSYEYLLTYARSIGLHAAFATIADISGIGTVSSYWTFNKKWKRVLGSAHTRVVFDKFSNKNSEQLEARLMLKGPKKETAMFHNKKIRSLFDNKLTTHETLGKYMLPTVAINVGSAKNIRSAKKALKKKSDLHAHTNDFSDTLILKGATGDGGDDIYKIKTDARFAQIAAEAEGVEFLLQPFIDAGDFNMDSENGRTDLRVIIGANTPLQSYIRTAKKGDFRANAKQGGSIDYISIDNIPEQVLKMIRKIQKTTNLKDALYTLDFMRSKNGNLYLVEGNASPGLTWSNPEDERRAKQLMRLIVKQMQLMAEARTE